MKVIDIPQEKIKTEMRRVKGRDVIEDGITIGFLEWLGLSLDNYAPLGKGRENQKQAERLFKTIEAVNGDKVLRFESKDFDVLKASTESMEWQPSVNRQIGAFYDALEKAQEVPIATKK